MYEGIHSLCCHAHLGHSGALRSTSSLGFICVALNAVDLILKVPTYLN